MVTLSKQERCKHAGDLTCPSVARGELKSKLNPISLLHAQVEIKTTVLTRRRKDEWISNS